MTATPYTHFGDDQHDPGNNSSPDAAPIPPRPPSNEQPVVEAAPAADPLPEFDTPLTSEPQPAADPIVDRIRAALDKAGVIAPVSITPQTPGDAFFYTLTFSRSLTDDELKALDKSPDLTWIRLLKHNDGFALVIMISKTLLTTGEHFPLDAGDPPPNYAAFAARLAAEEPPFDEQDTRELPQDAVEDMLRRQVKQLQDKLDDALTANNMLRYVVDQLTNPQTKPVEVKTLVQTVNSHQPIAGDADLAKHLTDRWQALDITVTRNPNDINAHTRIVTLVRDAAQHADPQPDDRVAVQFVDDPARRGAEMPPVIIPPGAQDIWMKMNRERHPVSTSIRQHGLDAVRAEMNMQALQAARAAFHAAMNTQPRYSALPGRFQ